MKLSFLVVNVTRGWIDGHYDSEETASGCAEMWAERCPGDYITVCEIKKKFGLSFIPDPVFMARADWEARKHGQT